MDRKLSPRIAKIADKPLWRPHPPSHYARWPLAGPLLGHHVQTDVIEEQWDELVRVAGSLKLGYVSASLLVARLQAGGREHPLAKALLEYGRLLRKVHALRWFTDEAFRRRIGRQLNKGESLNDLRRFIAYANAGKEKYRRHEDQTAQAHCLTLVVNICILSTTWYLQDAAEAHQADGHEVGDQVIVNISPGHFEALNPYGTHNIDVGPVGVQSGPAPPAADAEKPMKPSALLTRLTQGQFANVRFADAQRLAEALGFELDRVRGSHQHLSPSRDRPAPQPSGQRRPGQALSAPPAPRPCRALPIPSAR